MDIPKNKGTIDRNIREFISNNYRFRNDLMKNDAYWNQYLASLDVIGDCDLAINSYENVFCNTDGEKYLRLYGIMQTLFIQQDAVLNLIDSVIKSELPISKLSVENLNKISDNIKADQDIKDIRDARNSSTGHPTKRRNESYHFVVRIKISKDSFQLHSYRPPDYKIDIKNISIKSLITKQKTCLSDKLDDVLKILEEENKLHKEKFKMEKLEKIFDSLSFYIGDVLIKERIEPRLMHLELIEDIMKNFEKSLKDRDIELNTYEPIGQIYIDLEYPMTELKKYFNFLLGNMNDSHINDKTADIFGWYINNRLSELEKHAKNIDREYSVE